MDCHRQTSDGVVPSHRALTGISGARGDPALGWVLVVLLVAFGAPAASADTFTVGGDVNCDFSTIDQALAAAAFNGTDTHDVIRIADNQSYDLEDLLIPNHPVTLIGGHSSCGDTTPSGQTTIDGAGAASAPVIEVSGSSSGLKTVELVNLVVSGGEEGGLDVTGSNHVILTNTFVSSNDNDFGGGVYVSGSDALVWVDPDSAVVSNDSSSAGGGIYCSNGGTVLVEGLVATNQAGGNGGGIFVDDCLVNSFAGGSFQGIRSNDADLSGGGIYAGGGADVNLIGLSDQPAEVASNEALSTGGGIYARGSGTSVTATDTWITGNRAVVGGGVYVAASATFEMHRVEDSCGFDPRCSVLSDNVATANGALGGGVAVHTGALADVRQTYLEGNSSDFGAAGSVDGAGSRLFLESDVLAENVGNDILTTVSGGHLWAAFVTGAYNTAPSMNQVAFYTTGSSTDMVEIYSSVVYEPEGPVYGGGAVGATHVLDCLVVANDFGLPAASTRVSEADPDFVDPSGDDYHLSQSSPAVDYCDTAFAAPSDRDIDQQIRGHDASGIPSLHGIQDLGADELRGLFADGFESGDTSAWSSTSP